MFKSKKPSHCYINFPVDDPNYDNTLEGGMFVRLVVPSIRDRFMECSGGKIEFSYDETLVGIDTDKYNWNVITEQDKLFNNIDSGYINDKAKKGYHFNNIYNENCELDIKYRSIEYYAVINMGSTRWSGFNINTNNYWTCTKKDLTEEGKTIYTALKNLYLGCNITLQTWLDT